jgi:heme/copper-type cytochrome/quinol oxidase subunit 2
VNTLSSVPGRSPTALGALLVGLAVAFVVLPPRLAATGSADDVADRDHLVATFRTAVVGYWRSGDRNPPPDLQRVVDYWFRFHLIKGGIAALLLIVLGTLTVQLWRTLLRADGLGAGSRAALVSAGAAVPLLALSVLAVVMANIQGTLAPFSSLLPLLTDGKPDADLAGVLAQARRQLTGSHRTSGYSPPALDAMVSDFARYHAVLAVIAVIVVLVLLGISVMCWRSFARVESADRRTRRVQGWFGGFSAVWSLIMAVMLVANTGTAMDPAPALLALFNGSF